MRPESRGETKTSETQGTRIPHHTKLYITHGLCSPVAEEENISPRHHPQQPTAGADDRNPSSQDCSPHPGRTNKKQQHKKQTTTVKDGAAASQLKVQTASNQGKKKRPQSQSETLKSETQSKRLL